MIEEVTFCELLVFTLVTGIVSGVISAYIVRFLDKRRKNDRHSPKHGHFCVNEFNLLAILDYLAQTI